MNKIKAKLYYYIQNWSGKIRFYIRHSSQAFWQELLETQEAIIILARVAIVKKDDRL